jgi:glycosyltransferase involved in cell wall biosynthesis
MAMSKKVTVIIPTKNCGDDLDRCLAALQKQTYPNFEIILIDGHSTDNTVEIGSRYGARIFYEDVGTRAYACNIGLENSTGDIIAFTDADCIPQPNWLELLVKYLETRDDVVSVGGPNTTPDDVSYVGKCVDLTYGSQIMTGETRYGKIFSDVVEVEHNPGCNVAYKKEIIDGLQCKFENDLVTAEDVVFDHLLIKNGYKILFAPEILMWHRRRDTVKAYAKQVYRYGWGRAMANRRHKELEHWTHLVPIAALLGLILSSSLLMVLAILIQMNFYKDITMFLCNFLSLFLSMVFISYWAVGLVGAALSYSPYKKIRYICVAPLFMAIGHIMWGFGYLKGLTIKMKN